MSNENETPSLTINAAPGRLVLLQEIETLRASAKEEEELYRSTRVTYKKLRKMLLDQERIHAEHVQALLARIALLTERAP